MESAAVLMVHDLSSEPAVTTDQGELAYISHHCPLAEYSGHTQEVTYPLGSLSGDLPGPGQRGLGKSSRSLSFQASAPFHPSCHCCRSSPCIREEVGGRAGVRKKLLPPEKDVGGKAQTSPSHTLCLGILPRAPMCCRRSNPGPPYMLNKCSP